MTEREKDRYNLKLHWKALKGSEIKSLMRQYFKKHATSDLKNSILSEEVQVLSTPLGL